MSSTLVATSAVKQTEPFLYDANITFPDDKLPWTNEVLNELIRIRLIEKNTINFSVNEVRKKLVACWSTLTIPFFVTLTITKKLKKLFDNYNEIRFLYVKNRRNLDLEQQFQSSLNCLFDISQKNYRVEEVHLEDERFLEQQRTSRDGFLSSKEQKDVRQQEVNLKNRIKRPRRSCAINSNESPYFYYESIQDLNVTPERFERSIEENEEAIGLNEDEWKSASTKPQKKITVYTDTLCEVIDRKGISARAASELLQTFINEQKLCVGKYVLSHESLSKKLKSISKEKRSKNMISFTPMESVVVHFEVKKFGSIDNQIDHVIVTASFGNCSQVLALETIQNENVHEEIFKVLINTLLSNHIDRQLIAFCFKPTDVTEPLLKLIDQYFDQRPMLILACRHQIYESLLSTAFETIFGLNFNLNQLVNLKDNLFVRWQRHWNRIRKLKPTPTELFTFFTHDQKTTLQKEIEFWLKNRELNEESQELLQLVWMFLSNDFKYTLKGKISDGSWTTGLICCLKIYFFRESGIWNAKEVNQVRRFCFFGVINFVQKWIEAPLAVYAPQNDLDTIKALFRYKRFDMPVAEKTIETMLRHSW